MILDICEECKKTTLIFLTAGEVPTDSNLIASQVLKLADYMHSHYAFKEIRYIGFIPFRSWLKSKVKNRKLDFSFINKKPYKTKLFKTFFIIGGTVEYLFKRTSAKSDVNKLIKYINFSNKENIIFHCRSYYATFIAIKVKEELRTDRIKVMFDMRSLLPPEFPFLMKKIGKYLYGEGKEWESYLLNNSEVSLMTTTRAVTLLKTENPSANVQFIPITGFNSSIINFNEVFESRWNNKGISYIGSISPWHPMSSIEKVFSFLEQYINDSTMEIVTNSSNVKTERVTKTITHKNIEEHYNHLLALIIPGRTCKDYFQCLKQNTNFFSTKAAEAISKGVPLIVNEEIRELAEFVIKNECGIVFRLKKNIELVNCEYDDLNDRKFWKKLSRNMLSVSKEFTFTTTADLYKKYYNSIL